MIEYVNAPSVRLIGHNASDDMVAMAAWVSNDQDNEERLGDRKAVQGLINFLYRNRHMSPFEHGQLIFKIDCPLDIAREFHRHRTFSYNEVSGRYTEMKPRFYVPPAERPLIQEGKMGAYRFVKGSDEQYALMKRTTERAIENAWVAYQDMLSQDIAKEVARSVLPLSMMTQFYATVNPRNLMQFLSLRQDQSAKYEIRQVADQMAAYFADLMPLTYGAYERYTWTMVDAQLPKQQSPVDTPASGGQIVNNNDYHMIINTNDTNLEKQEFANRMKQMLDRGNRR